MTGLAECGEKRLDAHGRTRTCALTEGHTGPHIDVSGQDWEPPRVTLARLRSRWGSTHRIAWTGTLWVATARRRDVPWRSEIEPTPEQLEERLRTRPTRPCVPEQRRKL